MQYFLALLRFIDKPSKERGRKEVNYYSAVFIKTTD